MARTHVLLVLFGLALAFVAGQTDAQDLVIVSSDITVALGGNTFEDHEVVADDQMGLVSRVPLGTLPDPTDVNAYDRLPDGDQLYSLDTSADLGGGLVVGPADVVRFDGTTDTVEFDASAEGIPAGVTVDAVGVHGSGDLLLSFNTAVNVGTTVDDEDLVRFNGTTFTMFFDGSGEGVDPALDLDGARYRESDDHLFLSFDGSGVVGGSVNFDDEDILEFDPAGPTWSMFYDGSVQHASLAAADVIAVPEPHFLLQLIPGILLLAVLQRRRR